MKTFQLIRSLSLIVAIACVFPSCEKAGGMGPQGVQGEYGPKGEQGDGGASGAKGAKGERGDVGPEGAKGSTGGRGDTGATGPTGAQGDKGTRGDAGPQGPAGPGGAQGTAGIANVIYSEWIDPSLLSPTPDGKLEINAPKLTSEILDRGEVYVYLRMSNDHSRIFYVDPSLTIDGLDIPIAYSLGIGKIWIESLGRAVGGESDFMKRFEYRYVLIPGGTPGVNAINPMDYRSVSRTFQLEH